MFKTVSTRWTHIGIAFGASFTSAYLAYLTTRDGASPSLLVLLAALPIGVLLAEGALFARKEVLRKRHGQDDPQYLLMPRLWLWVPLLVSMIVAVRAGFLVPSRDGAPLLPFVAVSVLATVWADSYSQRNMDEPS